MSPASKEEYAEITKCLTKIEHLEEAIKELKQEVANLKTERKETQQRVSDRRLTIYLTLASILGATIIAIVD